ncbi:PQQ-binding-like beta-propeller repeat protein [Halorientalis brevis]|uniref:PQQ-binding-like beta-propeller repeat protein n=1 Tax=Halorientalis brevis TaxID=1126241 RepID=A0ABD6CAL8_9EURY|nr:PQQ-binding-like beta-propeller repeat protein [Halorientalis brevis]
MDAMQPSRRTVLRSMGCVGVFGIAGRAIQGTRAQQADAESWPRPRYDAGHSGYAPKNTGPEGEVAVAWTLDVESWRAFQPVIVNGNWIRETADGAVSANAMADGTERWWVEFDAESVSVLSAFDGTVYVQMASGNDPENPTLHALSAADGSEQWQRADGATAIVDDVAYRTANGLVATATEDGLGRWRTDGRFSSVSVGDGTVYTVGVRDPETHPSKDDEAVFAFSASDGSQQWTFEPDGKEVSTVVVRGDTVYFETSASLVYAVAASDGTERWRTVTSAGTAPVVTDDTVYVQNSERLSALSATDGSERWRYTAEITGTSPIVVGDTVYVGTAEGLFALAVDDGSERWHFETKWPVKQSPAVVDGTVLFVTRDPRPQPGGTVYALSGTRSTSSPTPSTTTSSPPSTTTQTTPAHESTTEPTTAPRTTTQQTDSDSSSSTDTVTASTASSPADDQPATVVTETATTDEDGPGFGVLSTLAGFGVAGWHILSDSDE